MKPTLSLQTKQSQPDVFLPHSPDRPTPAKCCILRHSWTTGFLPRHPAAYYSALRAGPEGTVRNLRFKVGCFMQEMLLEVAPHVLLWPDFMSSFHFSIYPSTHQRLGEAAGELGLEYSQEETGGGGCCEYFIGLHVTVIPI